MAGCELRAVPFKRAFQKEFRKREREPTVYIGER